MCAYFAPVFIFVVSTIFVGYFPDNNDFPGGTCTLFNFAVANLSGGLILGRKAEVIDCEHFYISDIYCTPFAEGSAWDNNLT